MREPIYHLRITDYDKSLLPNRFLAFLEESASDASTWVSRSGRSLGHPGWGTIYHLTLSMLDPTRHNTIVETGTNLGSTAIIIAQAIVDSHRDAVLHTIEIDAEIHQSAQDRFALAGVADQIVAHLGDSHSVLRSLVRELEQVRMAFLDGNHFHDHVVTEFELLLPVLEPDAVVVFDNTGLISENDEDPRVNGALRTIQAKHGGNLINFPFCSWYTPGMALWQRSPFAEMAPPDPDSFIAEKS
jgi:predicted O-methyltransferase YrrM